MYNKNGKIGLFKADNGGLFHLFRITFLFLLATIGFIRPVSAQTAEAAKTITLNVQNRPIKEVLTLIERQSDYIFVYYDNILDIHRKVTLKVTNQPISAVLKQLFAGTDNTWKLSGRQIVIGRSVTAAAATPRKITRITGVVRDQNNDPLIGVTIRIKARPNIGTATDINGKYLLDVYPDEVLEFSYVGYKSQDVSVAGQEIVDVVMLQNDAILDAVEVVGYGVQKKISVIGSQQTIATKELKVPVANLTQGLAGRVSGLVSVQRTSEPGFDDANIYIRGISTLTASMSAPLTLVDGIPRSFSNVDPEDIESFSILKDASATAVYGVRGANGVIIINTKSGLKGRPKFSVRYTEGLTKPTKITDFADGATYMEMSNEASLTRGGGKLYSQEIIDKTRRGEDPYLYPDVDWMKQILRNFSRNRSANVNVQGGLLHRPGLLRRERHVQGHETGRLQLEHLLPPLQRHLEPHAQPVPHHRNQTGHPGLPGQRQLSGIFAGKHLRIGLFHTSDLYRAALPRRQARRLLGRRYKPGGTARRNGLCQPVAQPGLF